MRGPQSSVEKWKRGGRRAAPRAPEPRENRCAGLLQSPPPEGKGNLFFKGCDYFCARLVLHVRAAGGWLRSSGIRGTRRGWVFLRTVLRVKCGPFRCQVFRGFNRVDWGKGWSGRLLGVVREFWCRWCEGGAWASEMIRFGLSRNGRERRDVVGFQSDISMTVWGYDSCSGSCSIG